MDADAIDLSKENIQPLRQGRKTAQLGLALKAQTDKDVQEKMLKEREAYELAIITYDGDDPLAPRHEYVQWIEQCCPKFGPESNMIPLLEDTIMLFKDDERYKQDSRFIELIIKYIETQDHAAELYQTVHSQGVGTKCAYLYKAWAECLDASQNIKGADQIYTLGMASNAEPFELLKELHEQFQLSVARRMLIGADIVPVPTESGPTERQRTVLGKLSKKSAAGSLRQARDGSAPMKSLLSESKHNVKINIYQEDENDDIISTGMNSNKVGEFAKRDVIHKENLKKPQPWNQGFSKKQRTTISTTPTVIPRTSTFLVLEDDDDDDDDWKESDEKEKTDRLQPTPVTASKVLKTRKSEIAQKTPKQLFESPHVRTLRGSMPKFEVFSGGREFSFEELRLAYYNKHRKEKNVNDKILECQPKELSTPCRSSSDKMIHTLKSVEMTPLPLVQEEDEDGEQEEKLAFEVYCD